jgi:hypothetical protein
MKAISECAKVIREDYRTDVVDDRMWRLFDRCWAFNPDERPTIGDILTGLNNIKQVDPLSGCRAKLTFDIAGKGALMTFQTTK